MIFSVLECVRVYHDFQEIWPHILYSINMYPKRVISLLKEQTLLLSTYHSILAFRKSWIQISHKWLVMLSDIVWAFYCKISYYCFLPYNKICIFVSWNVWYMCYSISWNFMHVSTKHRDIPLTFPIIENITSPIQFPKEFHDTIHINILIS